MAECGSSFAKASEDEMRIEHATKADFDELMDLMAAAFRTGSPDHPRFEELLPDLYQPTDEHMRRHFIIRDGGRIVSSVGLYPMDLQVGGIRLRVAGIGGVSTAPAHRGKGLMSAIMQAVREGIAAEGYALSWLSGLRDRYAHFGWEKAGSDIELRISKIPPASGAAWRVTNWVEGGSLAAIAKAREGLAARGLCNDDVYRLKLVRLGVDVWEAARADEFAYVAINRRDKYLSEWGGAVEGVRALVECALIETKPLTVRLPPVRDEYTDMFLALGDQPGAGMDNLAVFDLPALMRLYEPYLAGVWPRGKSLKLVLEPGSEVLLSDGRVAGRAVPDAAELRLNSLKTASLLFGPLRPSLVLDLPAGLKWLDQVFPLPFYVPSLWRV
jgi:predicted N-acetyltransferase YhbS